MTASTTAMTTASTTATSIDPTLPILECFVLDSDVDDQDQDAGSTTALIQVDPSSLVTCDSIAYLAAERRFGCDKSGWPADEVLGCTSTNDGTFLTSGGDRNVADCELATDTLFSLTDGVDFESFNCVGPFIG